MSDTPRTDAYRNRHNLTDVDEHGVAYWFSFARRLERELTEARAERDNLLAVQAEQASVISSLGPITCRNGKQHQRIDECVYCVIDDLHARITFLESHEEAVNAARIAQGDTIADLRAKLAERDAVLAGFRSDIEHIIGNLPASGNGEFFIEHFDLSTGEPLGTEQIDPTAVVGHLVGKMRALLDRSKQSAGDKP